MRSLYSSLAWFQRWFLLWFWLLTTGAAQAQAPTWNGLAFGSSSQFDATSTTRAVTTDADGNVFVTGYFTGTIVFGTTTMTSKANSQDVFIAKYVPTTNTWAWALSAGGTGTDSGSSIAVSGHIIYITGLITTDAANTAAVLFGGTSTGTTQVKGASANYSSDMVLARYTDQGTSASLDWVQVAGGIGDDAGQGVAVSGSSVYLAGYLSNNSTNAYSVLFGGNGTTAGSSQVNGASTSTNPDIVLAKYTDNGATGSYVWSQVGGGTGNDQGTAVAVSGPSVYLTGTLYNSAANASSVMFGGSGTAVGTTRVNGATSTLSNDMVLAKYTDQGSTGILGWTQVGGGINNDASNGVAVSGTSVYITGSIYNSRTNDQRVVFGGGGTVAGTASQYGTSTPASTDLVLAKYTDNGAAATFLWSQVGGGSDGDYGRGIAASGNNVFVTGFFYNNTANANAVVFGGSGSMGGTATQVGATAAVTQDVLVVKYQDNGSTGSYVWSQVAGSSNYDDGVGVAISSQQIYVVGYAYSPATFGTIPFTSASGRNSNFLARLTDATLIPLAVRNGTTKTTALSFYPNPAAGFTTLNGAVPGEVVMLLDALGRLIITATADATGAARLTGLLPGFYLVRAGSDTKRLVVE